MDSPLGHRREKRAAAGRKAPLPVWSGAGLVLLFGLTGCSWGAFPALSQAAGEASSAAATAAQAISLLDQGLATYALADTAVRDAQRELTGTEKSLAGVRAGTAAEQEARTRVAGLVRQALDAASMARDESAAHDAAGLSARRHTFERLAADLAAAGEQLRALESSARLQP